MQFKVPQFLDIEDKIFGPFTLKEFIYLTGGAGLCFVLYRLLGLILGIVPILIIAGLTLAFIFYRPNNKPFIEMVGAGFYYLIQHKLYIWQRRKIKIDKSQPTGEEKTSGDIKREILKSRSRLGGNKLRDLAWSLDVLDLNKHEE